MQRNTTGKKANQLQNNYTPGNERQKLREWLIAESYRGKSD